MIYFNLLFMFLNGAAALYFICSKDEGSFVKAIVAVNSMAFILNTMDVIEFITEYLN